VLTVFTVYVVVYLMAILSLYDLEKIGDRLITPMGTIQMLLGGLGLLQTVPLFSTLGVERGWWESFKEIVQVFATGGVRKLLCVIEYLWITSFSHQFLHFSHFTSCSTSKQRPTI
jgi:hypothetical protein